MPRTSAGRDVIRGSSGTPQRNLSPRQLIKSPPDTTLYAPTLAKEPVQIADLIGNLPKSTNVIIPEARTIQNISNVLDQMSLSDGSRHDRQQVNDQGGQRQRE